VLEDVFQVQGDVQLRDAKEFRLLQLCQPDGLLPRFEIDLAAAFIHGIENPVAHGIALMGWQTMLLRKSSGSI
jgi:hypothetical protein